MKTKQLPLRNEVAREDTWKMEDIYLSDKAWDEDYKKVEEMLEGFLGFKGRLGESADILFNGLHYSSKINELGERLYVYANQKLHQDTKNTTYQNLAGKAQSLVVKIDEASAFMIPEILEIPHKTLDEYQESIEGLSEYRQVLDNILRQKKHTLSAEMEALLSKVGEISEGPSDIFSMFNNADIKFPAIINEDGESIEITHGRFIDLLQSKDRRVRKEAFEGLYHEYKKFENTLAALYHANVKANVFYAKVKNHNSAREAALHGSNIPLSVYDNLIEAVHENLPIMHRYVNLRKKALGVEELHMYDLYTPLVSDMDKDIPFSEAKEIVKEGLKPLGEDYRKRLEEGFNNRWIDVYENQGKRSGAYSWGAYGIHPYVLLNYTNNLKNVFTLAHEMGHALHSYYSDTNQTFINAGYKIFVAEVASTCNESLLIHYLLAKATDKKEKAYLINYFMEQFRGTVFRQTMFAEFEKVTHELVEKGETLSADVLSKVYYDLNVKYYGKDIVVDSEIAMEWARIPHFYTAFYVYQYATGFSAAMAISKKILEGNQEVIDGYFKFLSSGSSMYPIDLLKLCGVDMTKEDAVNDALELFEDLVSQYEELI